MKISPQLLSATVLAAIPLACTYIEAKRESTETSQPAVPVVAVARAALENLSRQITLTGEFRPYQQVDLYAKVAGYLKQITVDVGHRVTTGQIIAELEVPELAAELERAVASRNQAQAEHLRTRAEQDRAEAAVAVSRSAFERLLQVNKTEAGLVAQQELDEAEARSRAAAAQVAAARAALLAAGQNVEVAKASEQRLRALKDYAQIRTPFAGVVTRRYADIGAMIQAGTASQQVLPVVRLADDSQLRLVLIVPEAAVPRVHVGQPVAIRVPALNRGFRSTFARFSRSVQPASRTMEAEVDVPNTRQELTAGMVAEAEVTVENRSNALTIPIQAISDSGGNRYVYVVNGSNVVEERQIQTGFDGSSRIEVLSGLTAEDRVIIGGKSMLAPGQSVQPKLQ
ncbi:MAG: efflux RND transporter periplasmic adaptor subunit [Acidobacteria bacterium]|nr:efflux RND transporter periplasmic adaptor subunit [Acidobacteriota bacterium]